MSASSALLPEPAIIVIFGITGDLAQRKLLPALYHLLKDDLLDEHTVILGITRRAVTAEELLGQVELCVNEVDNVCDPIGLEKVHKALRMHQMSLVDGDEYDELLKLLNDIETEQGVCMSRLYYLSIPPQMFEPIVKNLGAHGLNKSCQHGSADTRLLVEKPFGYDLASAKDLIQETGEWFQEEQLFRIDHYAAKETAQIVPKFRLDHPKVEKEWNAKYIANIDITAFEQIDIEGRATFYEPIGALRDFIQSHLLQLLAIMTMDLPKSQESAHVHASKLKLLQSIKPISQAEVASSTVRGQYEGYKDEVKNADSFTETYAEVTLHIDTPRWSGVSLILRTGKAMAEKTTMVTINFHAPDKRITYNFDGRSKIKKPTAYERVLLDAVRGDHTLFTTSDEVLAAWQIVDAIPKVWSQSADGLIIYPKGSDTVG